MDSKGNIGSSSDSDDVGPVPSIQKPQDPVANAKEENPRIKRRRVSRGERKLLDTLPSASQYFKSYMHRSIVTFVCATSKGVFASASSDGIIKFWMYHKKDVRYLHSFEAHAGEVVSMVLSKDEKLLASIGTDQSLVVFDVETTDIINKLALDFDPLCACWAFSPTTSVAQIAVSEKNSGKIVVFDGKGQKQTFLVADELHLHPVVAMAFNEKYNCMVSVDHKGSLEYWTPETPFEPPSNIEWRFKMETDLIYFARKGRSPSWIAMSPNGELFLTFDNSEGTIVLFDFLSGKIRNRFSEGVDILRAKFESGRLPIELDQTSFNDRLEMENRVRVEESSTIFSNAVFDRSGRFVLFPSCFGIKILNLETNTIYAHIGKNDELRYLHIGLCQNIREKTLTLEMATADNPLLQKDIREPPLLVCTAFSRDRVYFIGTKEPDTLSVEEGGRDMQNEVPDTTRDLSLPKEQAVQLATRAIVRTSYGDIHIRLFAEYTPRAVENFSTHCRNHYYDFLSFHRVARGFMIQAGDPMGDGTGGESIWGEPFADEFHPSLKLDQPYMVCMANRGPNTNGSQFFITTVATPWLQNKHTVFGKVVQGMDIVNRIENAPVRKERPRKPITIQSTEITD